MNVMVVAISYSQMSLSGKQLLHRLPVYSSHWSDSSRYSDTLQSKGFILIRHKGNIEGLNLNKYPTNNLTFLTEFSGNIITPVA